MGSNWARKETKKEIMVFAHLLEHMKQLHVWQIVSLTFSPPIQSLSSFSAPVIFLVLRMSPLQPVTANGSHAESAPTLQWNF